MSYTGTEIFNRAIAIIDELSDSGLISDSQVAEYKYRAPYLLDMWQKEYAKRGFLFDTIEIARKPLTNLLGDRFDIVEHLADDLTYETSEVAKSFCFKIDNEASVYMEEYINGSWVSVSGKYIQDDGDEVSFTGLITVPALTSPAKFKGILTATGTKTRLRFSGSYYYQFYNFALYEAAFPTCVRVPDYGEYVKYEMPESFNSISQITEENPQVGLYHRWENSKDLYIKYDYEGVLKITYKPTPTKITSLNQTLEINETCCISGAYYLAEQFAIADQNSELAEMCRKKYEELKGEDFKDRPSSYMRITDVY